MVCFDESRYLNDNFDDETLDIVKSLMDTEQQFMNYLGMMSINMQRLSLEVDQEKKVDVKFDQVDFHTKMAQVLDLAFAIMAEKRFLLFDELNAQTSPTNIMKLSQTLASFTDPGLWAAPDKRYMAFGVSSMRRFLTFGCFRNYDLGIQAFKDIYMASVTIGSAVFPLILTEFKTVVDESEDLDLRWVSTAVLDDMIAWCKSLKEGGEAAEKLFAEFIGYLGGLISEGPIHLSKANLMMAIEDLKPPEQIEVSNPEKDAKDALLAA